MKDGYLVAEIVNGVKKNVYVFTEAVNMMKGLAYPYAKKDEALMKALKRLDKMMGQRV